MSGGQQHVAYSAETEALEIVEAYTRKPDGRRIAVAPGSVYEQQAPGTQQVLMYTDQRQKVIIFPQVAAGDALIYTARIAQKAPLIAGHFWYGGVFNASAALAEVRETITVPKTMVLHVDTKELVYSTDKTANQVVHRWKYVAPPDASERKGSDFTLASTPHFFVSTFRDYSALGSAYANLAGQKIAVTPQVVQQAEDITRGVSDRRLQSQLIYDWVSKHIRYVGIEFGVGGYVPHSAESVLSNGYGDCKDHAVLLTALLKARGIDSEVVLINSGNLYKLSPVAAFQFDHVITWLPEFQLYLDSTVAGAPFGLLPQEEYGKPVVHASASRASLRTIPLLMPGMAETEVSTIAKLDEHGNLTGTTTSKAHGPPSITLRAIGLGIQAIGATKAAAAVLQNAGYEGATGSFVPPVLTDLKPDFTITGSFTVPNWSVRFADSGGSYLPGGLRLLELPGIDPMGDTPSDGIIDGDAPCFSGRAVEDVSLQAPPGRHFQQVPKNMEVKSDNLTFTVRWTLSGDRVSVHREFVSRFDKPFCTAAIRRAALPFLRKIKDSYNATVAFSSVDALAVLTDEIAKAPGDASKLYERGTIYYRQGDYDHAIADYKKAAALKPDDPDNFTALAHSYREKTDWARMLQNANRAVLLRPEDEDSLLLRSDAYRRIGHYTRARADADRVVGMNAASARAFYTRALAYQAEENCPKAIADFGKAIEMQSDMTYAKLQRARCYGATKDFDKEIADANSVLAVQPNSAFAFFIRAEGHSGKGETALAISDYGEALKRAPDYAAASNARAALYVSVHEYAKATADYSRILTLHPEYSASVLARGAEFLDKGDYDGAAAAYTAGVGIPGISSLHLEKRAHGYIAKGDLGSAIRDLTLAIQNGDKPTLTMMMRAIAYREEKEAALSVADYAQSLRNYDERANAHKADGFELIQRCWGRAIFGDELQIALTDCENGMAMIPAHEEAYMARGMVNYKLKRFDLALADYEAAVKLNDKSANALYMRGVTKVKLGRTDDGKADIASALKLSQPVSRVFAFYGVAA
jgi:tetratricopeptide (TPR) repeat protein/transglutaminase-like putative cysteine protease